MPNVALYPLNAQQLLYVPFFERSTVVLSAHTVYLCVCVDLRTNSYYFPIQL